MEAVCQVKTGSFAGQNRLLSKLPTWVNRSADLGQPICRPRSIDLPTRVNRSADLGHAVTLSMRTQILPIWPEFFLDVLHRLGKRQKLFDLRLKQTY